jgi:ATP/maltotriose-dependent transcriptional regulator MalT
MSKTEKSSINNDRPSKADKKNIVNHLHLAKIAAPRLHKVQGRARLFEMLDRSREQRIVWVEGPPGAGKTVLVSTYIAERQLRALWDQLDARDNDIASFFYYLALAFKIALPHYQKPLPRLTPEYLPGLLTFTQRFFEILGQRLETPAIIVLDNYHEVAPAALLHEVLREAVESLPHGVSFLVLSRSGPPAPLARLRVHGHLASLGGEDLKFTWEEVQRFVYSPSSRVSEAKIAELHEQTQGWAAGLRLLLDHGEDIDSNAHQLLSGKAQQVLFDYFATEVFERWPLSIQTALLQTALLPTMTVLQTEQLTGEVTVGKVLADLYQRNYFIVLRADSVLRYEYHPLFREFLLNRAQTIFDQAEWGTMQRRAADLLAETGQPEAAAPLYHAAQDWEGLKVLVLREARSLITVGRHQTLIQWLNFLPPTAFENTPWLWYWRGLARLPFNPVEARGIFEQAYLSFQTQGDVVGLYSSWSGIMDSFFFEWRDFTPVDRWITEFEELRRRYPEFPSKAVELRTYWSMGTLMHRQPHHPFLREWSERGLLLLDVADRDLSILLGGYLVVCFLW